MTGLYLGWRFLTRRVAGAVLSVFVIAGCILPILIVSGLKSGYVDSLIVALRGDPTNLEVRLRGDRTLGPDDFSRIRALPGAGYVEPTTRGLSLRVFVTRADGGGETDASLIPSSRGDPLLGDGQTPPGPGSVLLSAGLANRLGVAAGGSVRVGTRRSDGAAKFDTLLGVAAVLPAVRLSGNRLVVTPGLIIAIEDFVDGNAGATYDPRTPPAVDPARPYAGARIYADRLEAVEPLGAALEAMGFYVDTEAAAVAFVLSLDRAARLLVLLFGLTLGAGALLALWSSLSLAFIPQRRHLALLTLMGGTRADLAAYVFVQAVAIGGAGLIVSFLGFSVSASLINPLFDRTGAADVCTLSIEELVTAALAAGAAILAVAIGFTLTSWTVDATGALRDES